MVVLILFSLGACLALFTIYKWATVNDSYFDKRNLPHIKPYLFFGNTGGFFMKRERPTEYFTNLYNRFPTEKIFGLFDLRKPFFLLRDPEMVKQLAVKDFDYFEDHRLFIDNTADVMLGNSLIMLSGQKWRDMRATLSPAFTGSKMRQMFDLVGDCAMEMSHFFRQQAMGGKPIHHEMKDLFSKYTNDVIATCAFGITVNSFKNSENAFFSTGKSVMNFASITTAIKLILFRLVPKIMRATNIQFLDASAKAFFKNMVLDTIAVRKKQKIFRPDMINMLMKLKKSSNEMTVPQPASLAEEKITDGFATVEESSIGKVAVKRQWNDDEIVAQAFIFFFAGFETTSTLLSFLAYELAVNPDIQDKLYAEVAETNRRLGGGKLPYDDLQKMIYMDWVMSEALRKWPPAVFVDRLCVKDYAYNDGKRKFTIEKGTAFWIPIYAFHHDSKYFPNPGKFDPDRFSDENKVNIVSGSYIPFGVGPRNCIGSRFALMELKAVVYYLLLNFKFQPNDKTPIPMKLAKTPTGLVAEGGMHLELKLR